MVIRLPHSIGMLAMGLAASLVLVGVERIAPGASVYEGLTGFLRGIDVREAVLDGMLAFQLFAGALHVDLSLLRSRA